MRRGVEQDVGSGDPACDERTDHDEEQPPHPVRQSGDRRQDPARRLAVACALDAPRRRPLRCVAALGRD